MSLGSNSAGTFYRPEDSVQGHSHDGLGPQNPGQAPVPVQRSPLASGQQSFTAVATPYQANSHWNPNLPNAIRHASPHTQSPSGSHVSLPEPPTPASPNTMITPYYYEAEQAGPQDSGDYQQWVDDYRLQMQYAAAYGAEQTSPGIMQLPYQDPQHAPVAAPAMAASGALPPQMVGPYQFVQSSYMAPQHPQANPPFEPGYHFVDRSHPTARGQRPAHPTHSVRQSQHTAAPPRQPMPNSSTSAMYQPPLHQDYSHLHQQQLHQQYPSVHQDNTTGMLQAHPPVMEPMSDLPRNEFTFTYAPHTTDTLITTSSSNITPSSENAGLPSTPSSRPNTSDRQPQVPPSASTSSGAASIASVLKPARQPPSAAQPQAKALKRRKPNPVNDPESGSEDDDMPAGTAVPPLRGYDGNATRLPGACTHCKKLKMKCHFPPGENTCMRCKTSGHICVVEGRKPRNAPNKREYLLAQIRQKDAIIESLLKQLHNPYLATPLSIASYRMATSPSDQNNKNVLAWLDRLEDSVRTAGVSGGPSAFGLGSRAEDESAEEEESESDNDEGEEPTERGSTAGTVKVEENTKPQSLPDSAVPLGLIAELSLSSNSRSGKSKRVPKDDEEVDDDNVGVANATYFMPGPANDLNIRAQIIEKDSPPEILVHGLVTPEDVDKLFEIFFARLNCHVSVLDPVLHTPATTFKRCPFLFTVVCAVASRYYKDKSEIYPIAMHFAKHAAANALITGWKSVELAQAYIILSIYGVPARRWEEDRGWLYTGLAIRIATDLNLHHLPTTTPTTELQEREVINKVRVWMNCYNLDRSTATQFGKPSTIKEDFIVRRSDEWYKSSPYNHPYDIGLCAYTSQLRIMAKFHDEVFSDPDSPTGLNEQLDYHEVTARHDEALTRYFDDWTQRFATESDMTDPACAFRASLLPFFTNYSRLVMYSFGCQQAFRRIEGLQPEDRLFVEKCFESAKAVITAMVDSLAPSGFMRYAPDSHFIFGTFAAAFLLKLLKPQFMNMNLITKQQEGEIFELIHRLIQSLQSPEIAIDERHTPRLHARFLTGLLSRYKRDVATTGRLHTQPPPSQEQFTRGSSVPQQPSQSGSSPQVFSVAQGPVDSDHQMGHTHSSPDSVPNEPIYEPEAAYTGGAGEPVEVLDFDTSSMNGDDDMLGALRILKTPAYWSDMMTPGFQNQWAPATTPYNDQSFQNGIPGIHHSFNTFQAAGVA